MATCSEDDRAGINFIIVGRAASAYKEWIQRPTESPTSERGAAPAALGQAPVGPPPEEEGRLRVAVAPGKAARAAVAVDPREEGMHRAA